MVELHIEQGRRLEAAGLPTWIVLLLTFALVGIPFGPGVGVRL